MRQELKNAFNKIFLTILIDQKNRWVQTNWIGYLTEENIKAGAMAYTNTVADTGYCCVLNDTRQVVGGWNHSLNWVVNDWGPAAARAGIEHFALIANPDSFAQTSASDFYAQFKSFQVKVFDNQPAAENWLRQYSSTIK